MGRALDRHDFGKLFRLLSKHLGASQTRIGTATGLAQGTVCAIRNGRRQVTAIDVLERIADGPGMPDTAWLRLDLAPSRAGPPAVSFRLMVTPTLTWVIVGTAGT